MTQAQLPLPLTLPAIFLADNFFVSECNTQAYNTTLNKENWQTNALYLYGQKGAGKSHLAYIWAQKNDAKIINISNNNAVNPAEIHGNCVIEDIENCNDERTLFHLFNLCKESGWQLLITSSLLPSQLHFKLPDLTSRLRGCLLTSINAPDDAVLSAVMRKQFSDRQLSVDDGVISYLIPRIERSFAGVKSLVASLDTNALAEQKNITIAFAKRVIVA